MKVNAFDIEYDVEDSSIKKNLPSKMEFDLPDWLNEMEIESELWTLIPEHAGYDILSVKFNTSMPTED